MRRTLGARGLSLIEVLFATALATTLAGLAVPITSSALDRIRTAAAARQVAAAIAMARIDAVKGSAANALRFEPDGSDYVFTMHVDGNGNGVRTAEIQSGIDATMCVFRRRRTEPRARRCDLGASSRSSM